MKWPWVSRELYDAQADRALDMLADSRARYADLLEKYHALKLQGATIPEPVQPPREKKEPDALTQLVLNQSIGKPPSVRAMMLKQLAEDRDNPLLDDSDIQRRIESGFTPDDTGIPE